MKIRKEEVLHRCKVAVLVIEERLVKLKKIKIYGTRLENIQEDEAKNILEEYENFCTQGVLEESSIRETMKAGKYLKEYQYLIKAKKIILEIRERKGQSSPNERSAILNCVDITEGQPSKIGRALAVVLLSLCVILAVFALTLALTNAFLPVAAFKAYSAARLAMDSSLLGAYGGLFFIISSRKGVSLTLQELHADLNEIEELNKASLNAVGRSQNFPSL